MMSTEKIVSLIPFEEIEIGAQQQLFNIAQFDFCQKIAVMPDIHSGYLLPVGCVALFENVVSPEGIGYDEGCGMCCIVTDIPVSELGNDKCLKKLYDELNRRIPSGMKGHEHPRDCPVDFQTMSGDKELQKRVVNDMHSQFGTLGGGNHFIEIGSNIHDNITITIHSGSRHAGHTIASHYIHVAMNEDKHLPNKFLDLTGDHGKAFKHDLDIMLDFALANRMDMIKTILNVLGISQSYMKGLINENHNHAVLYGENGVLHRKGATPAEKGQLGVIPGNMRDGTYITRGLGNNEYLKSASHGAGRKGSRSWASKKFTLDVFEKDMDGIIAPIFKETLDECPRAYKNIKSVIKAQEGIVVDVVDYATPLIVIKGVDKKRDRKRDRKSNHMDVVVE